jgi:hypothetical protein
MFPTLIPFVRSRGKESEEMAAWPKEIRMAEGLIFSLGPRTLTIDLEEEPEEIELRERVVAEVAVGTTGDVIGESFLGSMREIIAGTARRISTAELIERLTEEEIFFRRGKVFRQYLKAKSSPMKPVGDRADAAATGEETDSNFTDPARNMSVPSDPLPRGKASRERYSQAVAFEFVQCVLSDILSQESDQ